jgi:hypothetical protein
MNPLGMVDALLCAMNHSAQLTIDRAANDAMSKGHEVEQAEAILNFTKLLKSALHNTFRYGQGTRDMAGPSGLTTEAFIDKVAWRLGRYYVAHLSEDIMKPQDLVIPDLKFRRNCELSVNNCTSIYQLFVSDRVSYYLYRIIVFSLSLSSIIHHPSYNRPSGSRSSRCPVQGVR